MPDISMPHYKNSLIVYPVATETTETKIRIFRSRLETKKTHTVFQATRHRGQVTTYSVNNSNSLKGVKNESIK